MNTKTAYISGAITGVENDNLPRFRAVQEMLEDLGYNTIVPHDLDPKSNNPNWTDWMRACLIALMDADILVSIPEDNYSKGAEVERHVSQRLSIPIVPLAQIKRFDEMLWSEDAIFRKEEINV